MAYFSPYIDESGLHIPTYNDTKKYLLDEARGIYGPDIYLENDSQDYEFISLISDRIHDVYQALQLAYNSRGPTTAIGGALTGLVKLNGLKPKRATNSKCVVSITGEAGTEIINGIIADEKDINWSLEASVTIPSAGIIDVMAICQQLGAIRAEAGQLNKIVTPISGWISVTNSEAATVGQAAEKQEQLRARQAISAAKPSRTVLEGTIGGIAEVLDVTRYKIYENDTDIFGYYGPPIPGHHISAVVEGGLDFDIANEIYLRKTPGCGTYGDVTVDIDSGTVMGMQRVTPISFFRPTYYDIWVTITIKKLHGYMSHITQNIIDNIAAYLNSLSIGDSLTLSAIWGVSLTAMPNLTKPAFSVISVKIGLDETNQGTEDITVPFNCVTRGDAGCVNLVFVT